MSGNHTTRQEITAGLKKLGLKSGDHVMVHSSLKSFGYVEGAADAVIDGVLDAVGAEGTMLVPTNVFNGSVTVYLRDNCTVDMRTAPAMNGKITETLRTRENALRSIHPSHPVAAIGGKADNLLSEHHLGNSPVGAPSPYGKIAQLDNGRILLLGVTNSNNTSIHTVEEYYTPYIFIGETFETEVTALDGRVYNITVKGYCINTSRNFTALDDKLISKGVMRLGKIGASTVTLIESKGMFEIMREEIGKNPYILLKRPV